jgi:hypothetical protein
MTTMPPHRGSGTRSWGEESIPRTSDAPIYEALAKGWVRAGRSVPGQHDREWAELAGQCPWPSNGRRRAGAPRPPLRPYAMNPYGINPTGAQPTGAQPTGPQPTGPRT